VKVTATLHLVPMLRKSGTVLRVCCVVCVRALDGVDRGNVLR